MAEQQQQQSSRPAEPPPTLEDGAGAPVGELGAILAGLLRPSRPDRGVHQARELRLYDELEALARYIDRAKREVAAIRCDDIATRHIPLASGELDAIGLHLEEATGVILDACEGLEAAGRGAGGQAGAAISGAVTRIYEACAFQDITGQRIAKIIETLQTIEERIARLLAALGHELVGAGVGSTGPRDGFHGPDRQLLNGPRPPGLANSQAEIDALLAGPGASSP